MPKLLNRKRTWFFISFFLAVIFLFVIFPSFFSGVRTVTLRTLSAPARLFVSIREGCVTRRRLRSENRALRKDLADLSLKIEGLKDLRDENERLRELLNFRKKIQYDVVSAEVIARNPNDWIGSFVIDRGAADGVKKDSAVCTAKGLLGKVTGADAETSSVMMIIHPGFKAGGMIKGTGVNGIVVGSGKGTLRMLYIPVDADVGKGDVVVTSGFSRIFPRGIPIGEVVSVGRSRTGLYKYAVIRPSANLFEQEEVLCIK